MRAYVVVALVVRALAQPPSNPGLIFVGTELPGNPRAVIAAGGDGQDCAFQCMGELSCVAFNYEPTSCSDLHCPHASGCCWLFSDAASTNMTPATCASSMMMRPRAGAVPPVPSPPPIPAGAKNVLYIVVDDMRPDAAPFGEPFMVTPNLGALAKSSTYFSRAYCNIAVCSPSRMSFLTGRYPHNTLSWNFVNHIRQADCEEIPGVGVLSPGYKTLSVLNGGAAQCCTFCTAEGAACAAWSFVVASGECSLYAEVQPAVPAPGRIYGRAGALKRRAWTTMPQWLTQHGWRTTSSGKIFHTEEGGDGPAPWDGPGTGMPPLQDPVSWTQEINGSMAAVNGLAPMRNCPKSGCSINATKEGIVPEGHFQLCDRIICDDAISKLQGSAANFEATQQPFFLAVGFRKPHLPFRHPAPWDAEYPAPDAIPLARYKTMNASTPPIAFHEVNIGGADATPFSAIPDATAGLLRRDYYACISWIDFNLGRLLAELESLGRTNDTAVVFHADHGWSLGEAGEWEKFTNWEHGTRVPLLVRAPWIPASAGRTVQDVVELVDVYPTVAELAGVPVPAGAGLDGTSLLTLMSGPGPSRQAASNVTTFALSAYPRCPANMSDPSRYWAANDCTMAERTAFPFMGLSLRTGRWRYTEWLPWNASLQVAWNGTAAGIELYDHEGDTGSTFDGPWEQANLAGLPAYAAVQAQLAAQLREVYPNHPAWGSS